MPLDTIKCGVHWDCCSAELRVLEPFPGHSTWNLVIDDAFGDTFSYIGLTVQNIDALVFQLSVARAALL